MCGFHARIVVTYAYICLSGRSNRPRGPPSALTRMLPYRYFISHGFGGALNARSSSIPDRSTSELLRTL